MTTDAEKEKQRKFRVNFEIEKNANAARLRGEKQDAIAEAKRRKAAESAKEKEEKKSGGLRNFVTGMFPQQRSGGGNRGKRRRASRQRSPPRQRSPMSMPDWDPMTLSMPDWDTSNYNPLDPPQSVSRKRKQQNRQSNPFGGIPDDLKWMF